MIHYILLVVCIAFILWYQWKTFKHTGKLLGTFRNIFPKSSKCEFGIVNVKDEPTCIVNYKDAVVICSEVELVSNLEEEIESLTERQHSEYIRLIQCNLPEKLQGKFTDAAIAFIGEKYGKCIDENDDYDIDKIAFDVVNRCKNDTNYKYDIKPDAIRSVIKTIDRTLDSQEIETTELYVSRQIKEINLEKLQDTIKRRIAEQKFDNESLQTIVSSINNYLQKNRNSSADFHLMKDIVDRNCDSAEEEINAQIPVPLYCGLAGTMIGIIIGVGSLCLSGDLNKLLNATGSGGADGIESLIGGVAIAMIASLVGVALTTALSLMAKDAKKECERNKHNFLSWIQAELLPVLSTDAMSAISKMTANLSDFNATFSNNAKNLKEALTTVKDATHGQAEMLATIHRLNIGTIVSANIEMYDKLKDCKDEIGLIGDQLKASRQYLQSVSKLTEKLDDADKRTRMIEELANYFMTERSKIDAMNGVVSRAVGEADSRLQDAVAQLKDSVSTQYQELTKHFIKEREDFEKVADEQQAALEKRMNELNTLTSELKKLTDVKASIEKLANATESHNRKLEQLVTAVRDIAHMDATGEEIPSYGVPKWAKIAMAVGGGVVVLSCLLAIFIMITKFVV